MKLTFYGHACFGLDINGTHILVDPFIRGNELASHIVVEDIKADYILISHGHDDHLADAIEIGKRTGATIISNFEIVQWFGAKGYENLHPINQGGAKCFEWGSVKYVNAIHSSILPDGSYGGNPGGFIVKSADKTIYYAGDTALTMDMKLIPIWGPIDLAVLPIGDNFTMGFEDAAVCAEMVECNEVLGVHYDTFGYIKIDHAKAQSAFEAKGKKLHLLEVGASMDI